MCLAELLDVLAVAERVQGSPLELVGGVVQEVGHSEGERRRGVSGGLGREEGVGLM